MKSEIENNSNKIYQQEQLPLFTPEMYENMGQALLISILDIFEKNPYSRIPNSIYQNIKGLRRSMAWICARTDRFRKDPLTYKKVRQYNDLINGIFFNEFRQRRVFEIDEGEFKDVEWPDNIRDAFLSQHINPPPNFSSSNNFNEKNNAKFQRKNQFIRKQTNPADCGNNPELTAGKPPNLQKIYYKTESDIENLDKILKNATSNNYYMHCLQGNAFNTGNSPLTEQQQFQCHSIQQLLAQQPAQQQQQPFPHPLHLQL